MRQGPHPKRLRGRGGRKNSNPRNQTFDSNGPEVRVRGNAQQVVEKYLSLARDATSAGDRVAAESYFQHAEHYYRIMMANGGDPRDNPPNTPSGLPAEPDYADGEQPDITAESANGAAIASDSVVANGRGRSNGRPNGSANGASQLSEDDAAPGQFVGDGGPAQA